MNVELFQTFNETKDMQKGTLYSYITNTNTFDS